jgi:glycosyltransferase involved in cell wall biosynthesis
MTTTRSASITFAVPYYRQAAYLLEAVESVRAQTIDDWELVIVDNCGPEPADELVSRLGDDRIRYLRNSSNIGIARNWNECLRQSRTDLVTLLHSDDRLLPEYGSAVLDAAQRMPAVAAVFTDTVIIGPDGLPARSLPDFVKRFARRSRTDHFVEGDQGLSSILSNNYIFCPSLCYRKSRIEREPFDNRWAMVLDLDNTSRLLLNEGKLFGIRRPLYEYRRHGANQTSMLTADSSRFVDEIALYREISQRARAQGWTRSAGAARRRSMVRAHLSMQTLNELLHARVGPAREKARLLWDDLRDARYLDSPTAVGEPT